MKSIGQSLLVALLFAAIAGYSLNIKAGTESAEIILGGAAAAGFCLYWGWKFTRSIVGSLLSTSNNLLQVIFKVGAYWCAGSVLSLAVRGVFGTVPLEEYLKVGVSIVCWIGMATSYLAYRRAADHPLPVVSATSQAPATPPEQDAAEAAVRTAAERVGHAVGQRLGRALGGS
ncbi:MAG: hypothetical protein KDJ30_16725 [Rhodoblastus sp.]|nr:hypothetical protein [Rhodoblastus sp.]